MSDTNNNARARNASGRFAKKDTVVIDVDSKETESSAFSDRFTSFEHLFANIEMPRRPLAGLIVNIVVAGIGGYCTGILAGYIAVGAAVLTGSAFIAMCMYVLALVVGIIASARAGAMVGRYVAMGQFEDDYQVAKGWVGDKLGGAVTKLGGLFRRNTEEA